jgi:hypothetical protein
MSTRRPYRPDARTLLGNIEQFRDHTHAPRWDDSPTVAQALVAELKFAEARGLAVGLVEAGYVEVPFTYTVDEALNAAYRKAAEQVEFDEGVRDAGE